MARKNATNTGSRGRDFGNPPSNNSKTKSRVYQSDSAFAGLVKLLYGVLQCIHHIGLLEENLVNSTLPKSLARKVEELNSFIKPARPNLDITFDLNLTNQNWANQTMNVLIKHYANSLKLLKSKIISAMSSKNLDFDRAQFTAIKWGRKNYKTKLTDSSLSEFSRYLSDLLPNTENSVGSSCQTTTPLPQRQKRARSPRVNTPSNGPDLKATPPIAKRSTAPHLTPLPNSPPTPPIPSNSCSSVPRLGTSFADALKSPTAPNRNSGRDTNFRQTKFYQFRHNVSDKSQWRLPEIKKKTLLFGSSNLSRINLDTHPEVQVECYPGANFNHFRTMASNYKGKSQPETIVLNIGINSKDQNPTSAINQLRNMISSIRKCFPRSKILFIELNFSDRLLASQKTCLNQINLAAKTMRNIQIIPALHACDFEVGQDNIHWTETTANKLYRSWMRYLNLN
ncbi:uncharacterized protein LOC121369825 isoform X2 [Gigantopelta aegis]|uniref:uncharacterized protein LOC121369825 isoform X2 n=1 Tax=Gigantopelta aegis TaxID=1735272 RepID=UPI001B88DAC7|nr:uncharacterized protein LOC121369825 isoform X2 [Gigantopelta aegis]